MKQKTLRRTKGQAETFARMKREAGHTDVVVKRITATDWSIVWTVRSRR